MTLKAEAASVLLYAELLPNIRQISLGCLLPSPSSRQSEVDVSPDGEHVTVRHDGRDTSFRLPGRVQGGLKPPIREGQTSITFRLPVRQPDGGARGFARPTTESQAVPWPATDIVSSSSVTCRHCKSIVVAQGVLSAWKDLPSENWAEMMEFWHCHKPDEHKQGDNGHGQDHDHLAATRGYGASSRITAQPGLGFVDLTSFLIATGDVSPDSLDWSVAGPKVRGDGVPEDPVPALSNQAIATCHSCKTQVGLVTPEMSSISLFKWQVDITATTTDASRQTAAKMPSLAHCVSSMLLAALSRTGCSKSILMPIKAAQSASPSLPSTSSGGKLLHIWLFNGNITYSSSVAAEREESENGPQAAIKVLFKFVSEEEADKLLHSMTSDTQDVSLPPDAIGSIAKLLRQSNSYLPPSEQTFKEWTVGLVSRWQE